MHCSCNRCSCGSLQELRSVKTDPHLFLSQCFKNVIELINHCMDPIESATAMEQGIAENPAVLPSSTGNGSHPQCLSVSMAVEILGEEEGEARVASKDLAASRLSIFSRSQDMLVLSAQPRYYLWKREPLELNTAM